MARPRRRSNKSNSPKYTVTVLLLLVLCVLLSFFGRYYWLFDLFSHFVLQYAAISLLLAAVFIVRGRFVFSLVAIGLFSIQLYEIYPLLIKKQINEEAHYDQMRVLQYNVNRNNRNIEEVTRWLVSHSEDTDIIVLLEVNDLWQDSMRRIKWAYPYHIVKDMRGGRQMAVFSRLYIDEMEVKYVGQSQAPAIVLRGETIGYEIPFVLYGAHPPPPVLPGYYKTRNDILVSTAQSIASEKTEHKIWVADFNSTGFSHWFEKAEEISGLGDSNEGLGLQYLRASWPKIFSRFFGLNIDNMMVSDNIDVVRKETGPAMGSDHFPVITTLRLLK